MGADIKLFFINFAVFKILKMKTTEKYKNNNFRAFNFSFLYILFRSLKINYKLLINT